MTRPPLSRAVALMLLVMAVAHPATLLTPATAQQTPPLTGIIDPCAIGFEKTISYGMVSLPGKGQVKTITLYRIPEGYIVALLTNTTNVSIDLREMPGEPRVGKPVFCMLARDSMFEARIGPLNPPFTLSVIVGGEEYIVTQRVTRPLYIAEPMAARSVVEEDATATLGQPPADEEEGEDEYPAEEEAPEVDEVDEKPGEEPPGEEEREGEAEAGAPRIIVQTLPLAVGTVTFALAYLVSRRII